MTRFLSVLLSVILISTTPTFSFYLFLGLVVFFDNFFLLFQQNNSAVPIRQLAIFFAGFQTIITAYLAYYVFPSSKLYAMAIDSEKYFSFMGPAFMMYALGIKFLKYSSYIEAPRLFSLRKFYLQHGQLHIYLFFTGMIFTFIRLPGELSFIGYFLSSFKFAGIFIQILSSRKVDYRMIVAAYGLLLFQSFSSASFHDLVIWTLFLVFVISYKVKPSQITKFLGVLSFAICIYSLQLIKAPYRTMLKAGYGASLSTAIGSFERASEDQEFLSTESLSFQLSRYNQGWIIAGILKTVPAKVPFAEGETMWLYFQTALLPRFFAPEKLTAGDKSLFNKYSGVKINDNTSMALSSFGDAYINFGKWGGIIFMFFYGLLFAMALKYLSKLSSQFPPLGLLAIFAFIYPIRIESATPTILTHLFKSLILLFVIFQILKKRFSLN